MPLRCVGASLAYPLLLVDGSDSNKSLVEPHLSYSTTEGSLN